MQEMDVQSVDLGSILAESVQHSFASAPIVSGSPILDQTLQAIELDSLRKILNCLALRPASGCEPPLKVVQLVLGHIDRKRYYIGHVVTSRLIRSASFS
jgi:hypothetical protein